MSSPMPWARLILASTLGIIMFAPSGMGEQVLYSGETLSSGQSLTWGPYVFSMQYDCNLVLYENSQPIWATNTGGRASGCRLDMQNDGNLVVYDQYNNAIWSSGSQGEQGNYVCILQKDRNVVIYGSSRWASGTYRAAFGITAVASAASTAAAAAAGDGAVMVN